MKTQKASLWMLPFFGFVFIALAFIDIVLHKVDAITTVFIFFGTLSFAVNYCLQAIEKRLTMLEQSLRANEGE